MPASTFNASAIAIKLQGSSPIGAVMRNCTKTAILAVIAMVSVATQCRAHDGNWLLKLCSVGGHTSTSPQQAATSFVMGAVEALEFIQNQQKAYRFCRPSTATGEQIGAIACTYFERNPSERQFDASSTIGASMIEAFPCKQ